MNIAESAFARVQPLKWHEFADRLTSGLSDHSQFCLMIDAIPAIVWSANPDGSNTFYNQRFLDYIGASREEGLRFSSREMIHPDDQAKYFSVWNAAIKSGSDFECEARLRRYDGAFRSFLVRAEPLRGPSGNIVEWYGTNVDIHDRRTAEQALQHSKAYLAETLRLNGTGTFGWNASNGEIFYWSDEACHIFGMQPGERPTLKRILASIQADDLTGVVRILEDAPDRGELDFCCRVVTPCGVVKHIHVTAHVVPDEMCHLYFLGAVADVTDRVKKQDLLNRLQADFAHASRVSLLGELTASIAHEIAQPLSAISANGEAGLRWLEKSEPNLRELADLTGRIVTNARRATDIIGRVRSMATGAQPVHELISVDEVVQEALLFLRHEIIAREASVQHVPAVSEPLVVADRIQLQQVVVNLVMNAMQALERNPIRKIIIKTDLDECSVVRITIDDTGIGISPEDLPFLFNNFFTTKEGGMGIGLPLCKSILEAHGGNITAQNRDGFPGARLVCILPLAGATDRPSIPCSQHQ